MTPNRNTGLLVRGGEVDGSSADVLVEDGRITALGAGLRPDVPPDVVDVSGAVLPGLHDHHLHLLAMAAARASLDVTTETDPAGFDRAVAGTTFDRVVGYHEHHHGPLDRARLDRLGGGRPLRVQHATGAAWVLSTGAADERKPDDDGWRWGDAVDPDPTERDLAAVGAELAAVGVTGVTDATPFDELAPLELLAVADLPQRVVTTGGPGLIGQTSTTGPVKLVIADHEVPDAAALTAAIERAHEAGRPVAVHCVTSVGLAVLLAAWGEAGGHRGDRVEHAAVVPDGAVDVLAGLGVTVVTQPNFVRERGDRYLANVDAVDRPDLWRCGSLLAAGIPVAAGTDAPFGQPDPWAAMAAAVDRHTGSGVELGGDERVTAARALDLFLGALDDPGGPPRRVEVGAPADLCVLDRPLIDALADLATVRVAATIIGGSVVLAL